MMDKNFIYYALVFIFVLALTAIIEKHLIPFMKRKAEQPIYIDGPIWHQSKAGTPTMGGLAFIGAISLSMLFVCPYLYFTADQKEFYSALITVLFAIANGLIGLFDDITKIRRKDNGGLTPKQKILLQLLVAIIFLFARSILISDTTKLYFAFADIELGLLYYPLAVFLILGIVNCANLTDGVDGLAASCAFAIGLSLFYLSFGVSYSSSFVSIALMGGSIGFLIYNINPAKIFMGDTGSLFLGALIVGAVFSLDNPILLIPLGIVYVIEGVSVILQVIIFKLTRKRLFKMAPLHHHLEKSGYSENKICIYAILVTFVFSLIAYILYIP